MQSMTIKQFLNDEWKKPVEKKTTYMPAIYSTMSFTFNEPTTFLITGFGIGVAALILEHLLQDSNYIEWVRQFRYRYIKYAYPVIVVAAGVYIFVDICKILL